MDCHEAEESILESFEQRRPRMPEAVATHVAGCPACARFAARQDALDARLAALIDAPKLTPAFRAGVWQQVRADRSRAWQEMLPDVVHFVSCAVVTVACAIVLPFDARTTVAAGVTVALLAYVLLTLVRATFEDVPQGY